MKCAKCNATLPAKAKFCPECATPVSPAGSGSVSIGGNVSGSNIVVGDRNQVNHSVNTQTNEIAMHFKTIYQAIETSERAPAEKTDLVADVKEIEAIVQDENVEEDFLTRRLRNLKRMAPDIADVA